MREGTTRIAVLLAVVFAAPAFIALADTLPRYSVKIAGGESEVSDGVTGLTWQQRSDLTAGVSWEAALQHCEDLQYAGREDWRLPNVSELLSLVDEKKQEPPAINTVYFDGIQTSNGFWTSTTSRTISSAAYVVYFNDQNNTVGRGGVSSVGKTSKMFVLCVRGGRK